MADAEAPVEDLPVVEVLETSNGNGVVLKWGKSGSEQTTAGLSDNYTDSFHATASDGTEPFRKTFGTLLRCNGGVLTICGKRYPIQAQQQQESSDPGYPFSDSIFILYSKPSESEVSVIATAFAVTNTLACTAGHSVSEKNSETGQALEIDEPLFLTSVLVRNDG